MATQLHLRYATIYEEFRFSASSTTDVVKSIVKRTDNFSFGETIASSPQPKIPRSSPVLSHELSANSRG